MILAGLFLSLIASAAPLDKGRVDKILIGSPIAHVKEQYPAAKEIHFEAEGTKEPALEIPLSKGKLIVRAPNGRVYGVIVRTPELKTTAGVGVGSTFADLRKAYKGEVRELMLDEDCHCIAIKSLAMSFSLDPGKLIMGSKDLRKVPADTPILSVWVH